ncbi:MAG: Fic family protein [Deltaproteobacteria bacterium]|nr:Fic family protein [Deltaproteobacteria bacterium]
MTREYETTHPWLRFSVDLNNISPEFWMLLGEVRSKCEHIRGVPLRTETAQRLHNVFLAKGVLATTAIEGNTLSLEQVQDHLEGKLRLPPSKAYLQTEIDNILKLTNTIFAELKNTPEGRLLSPDVIKLYNRQVLERLPLDEDVIAGEIRKHNVGVGRYRGSPAEDCDYLLKRLCDWINSDAFNKPEYGIALDVIKAVLAHLYLAWIHPFGDGNGRTARIVEFHILAAAGVPTPACHLLSNHYNETRTEYYRQLDQASRSGGDIRAFLRYTVQGFVDQLKEQLDYIRVEQWDVTWRNFVHENFRPHATQTAKRQRDLVLDLSRTKSSEWVRRVDIAELTPRLAAAYANKTAKTLVRDINALQQMGLVKTRSGKVRAYRELILAFLPESVSTEESGEDNEGTSAA